MSDTARTVDHRRLAEAPCSDHGNALRFAAHADGLLCWTPAHGWMRWKGTHWKPTETDDAALQLARVVATEIVNEAALMSDVIAPGERKSPAEKRLDWSLTSQDARRLKAMVQVARGSADIVRDSTGWDCQIGKINTPDGLLDLQAGTLAPQTPSLRAVKVAPASPVADDSYDDAWAGSTWARFLDWAMCGDRDLGQYLQVAVGASLVGDQSCQHVFFCYGSGGNGKGAFERALRNALGPYVHALPRRFLELTRGPAPASDEYSLAHLQGARMAIGAEVSRGATWDEEKIKSLSGGDMVTARHPYGRPFSFAPSWVLWVLGNDRPRVEGTDSGIWRRLRLIPWLASTEHTPPEQRIANLEERLAEEAPIILRWAQAGAAAWMQTRQMPACAVVDDETMRYRQAEDTIGQALDEMCEFAAGPGAADQMRTQSSTMTRAVIQWHKTRGLSTRAMDRQLGEYLRRRLEPICGSEDVERRVKGTRYWIGVRLVDEMAATRGDVWH